MRTGLRAATLGAASLCMGGAAQAAENWWPVKVYNYDSGKQEIVDYTPLPKAAKPWNVCVLFPHMKDTFWVAVDYGVVQEAKRMGVNMTLYEAGGYENLPKQPPQFHDCITPTFHAPVPAPVSPPALTPQFRHTPTAATPASP